MTLCNCCEELVSNPNWRKYIGRNYYCHSCKKFYYVFARTENYINLLRKLEKLEKVKE